MPYSLIHNEHFYSTLESCSVSKIKSFWSSFVWWAICLYHWFLTCSNKQHCPKFIILKLLSTELKISVVYITGKYQLAFFLYVKSFVIRHFGYINVLLFDYCWLVYLNITMLCCSLVVHILLFSVGKISLLWQGLSMWSLSWWERNWPWDEACQQDDLWILCQGAGEMFLCKNYTFLFV